MWDIISAHKRLVEFLEKSGVESPRLVSEILLSRILGIRRIDIYASFDVPVSEEKLKELNPLVKQIREGVPLQLVIGDTQFMSYTLKVRRGVFIPRPETEELVDFTAKALENLLAGLGGTDGGFEFIDIGCGTGVVVLSLLKIFPDARAFATDINQDAIVLTRENAAELGLEDRLTLIEGNMFDAVPDGPLPRFRLIVSNPPYIPTGDIAGLEPVVRDHDPREALDGGADGLDVVREILRQSPAWLMPGGLLALELADGQPSVAVGLALSAGFVKTRIEKDLSGKERFLFAWKG